ncbi:uncharacterized protein BP5553_09206 [Venustampulla echinocandica]|uniref:P-loop containing nucleoside triphosphate hydrolase n=1 Tax=Venustampulla echinocandica TaxID=2656787 RepID=A0A370TC35_9HELO|nr:uncharacterized protein BP5553_09206 [Venustampulla echinocandica]RDL31804.1 hypothetical protein BP5553_09206 [Venustampulla echinocandica]
MAMSHTLHSTIVLTDRIDTKWTRLFSEGYVVASKRWTKRAYEALDDPEVDGVLDTTIVMSNQMKQHGQFPTLDKIDKVFACNVGDYIDLPKIVVVGDQYSGKSSVFGRPYRLTL